MKLKTALLSLCVLLTGLLQTASGQNLPVSGTVTNKSGEPLVGATIAVKGTRINTMTDGKGQFTISIPKKGSVLVISYAGMKQVDVTVSDNNMALNIQLEESAASTLTDVVVVGYGTQKITKVSGAISTIKSADIEKLKPVRVEEALQGRASGVVVVNSGTPGSKPTVLVRGIPSFSGTDPLVIIDGGSPDTDRFQFNQRSRH
jgi:hypothetical protein